jgi:acetoin utilization protein AcuB
MQIKDILIPGLKTISIEASMSEAQVILKQHNFRHLPVIDNGNLVGILSDRDIQRAMTVIISGEQKHTAVIQKHKKVSEYMSSPVHKMKDTELVSKLVREMVNLKVSCMIIENYLGKDVGIMTNEDLLILLLDLLEKKNGPLLMLKKVFRLGKR